MNREKHFQWGAYDVTLLGCILLAGLEAREYD